MTNPTPRFSAFLLAVGLSVWASPAAPAQDKPVPRSSDNPTGQETPTAKQRKKPRLADLTRVSTADAIREAKKKTEEKRSAEASADQPAEEAVTEFRPLSPNADTTGGAVVAPDKDSKKSGLKNLHGTVHGSLDPGGSGTRTAGVAAGVSSKGGKTHVYVETERVRTSVPPAH